SVDQSWLAGEFGATVALGLVEGTLDHRAIVTGFGAVVAVTEADTPRIVAVLVTHAGVLIATDGAEPARRPSPDQRWGIRRKAHEIDPAILRALTAAPEIDTRSPRFWIGPAIWDGGTRIRHHGPRAG